MQFIPLIDDRIFDIGNSLQILQDLVLSLTKSFPAEVKIIKVRSMDAFKPVFSAHNAGPLEASGPEEEEEIENGRQTVRFGS